MMTALPGQDPNMPPQQPYMPGQQPMYQQVRTLTCHCMSVYRSTCIPFVYSISKQLMSDLSCALYYVNLMSVRCYWHQSVCVFLFFV